MDHAPPVGDAPVEPTRRSPLKLVLQGAAAVLVAGSFLVWIYALSGAARQPPPDELDSTRLWLEADEAGEVYIEVDGLPAYLERAAPICEATIDSLPDARLAASGPERASQLRQGTASLEAMVLQLRTLPVGTERDDELRSSWLDDWEVLIADRYRYADAVEIDPAAVFTVTDVADNERLERRLTRFARTNLMLSCAAPTDVG